MLSPDFLKRMKELRENPIGFKCWDCEKEIINKGISKDKYKNSPVSKDGYIMLICKECGENEG